MRVWLVNAAEPLPTVDGERRRFRMGSLGEYLVRAGHTPVRIASSFDHFDKAQRHDAAVAADRPHVLIPACSYRRHASIARIRHNRQLARRFRGVATTLERPDVIVVSYPPIELAAVVTRFAARQGVPVVVDVRDMWPDVAEFVTPRLLKPLVRLATVGARRQAREALGGATAVTAHTDEFLTWALRRGRRERGPADKSFPFGFEPVATDGTRRQRAKAFWDERGIVGGSDQAVVCYAGSISRQFDWEPVLGAAELLLDDPRFQFVLCGLGDRLEFLRRRVTTMDNVQVTGWVDMPEVLELEACATLALVSVYDRPDYRASIPNKVPEYLCAGLPIAVGYDDGVVPRLVSTEGCGFAYGGRGDVLAEGIRRVTADPASCLDMKRAASATFERMFRADEVYTAFVQHLERLAAPAAALGPAT